MADDSTHCALLMLSPTAVTEPLKTAELAAEMRQKYPDKPVFAAFMGGERLAEGTRFLADYGIPTYTFPEPAVKAISGMVNYAHMRQKIENAEPLYTFDNIVRQ